MGQLQHSIRSDLQCSIIILTKNGAEHFRALLEGLYAQKGIESSEVIVIDSGSTDPTLEIAAAFPVRLVQIPAHEFGHGRTRNLGARMARGTFLVFLPQDATPIGSDWLENLLQPFGDPSVAGAFGKQVPRANTNPMERYFLERTYHDQSLIKRQDSLESASLAHSFFSTVSGAMRASSWERLPFREDIIMSEDQAWARDAMQAGYAIAYQPSARVFHSHNYSVIDTFRRNFDSGYSVRQIFDGKTGISALEALGYLAKEAFFVAKAGPTRARMTFVPYEIARHVGFWLGLNAYRLPVAFCKRCSKLGYFWDQRD